MCAAGGDDGGASEEEFREGWGAREGEVECEVFGGEGEAAEEAGSGGADGGEGCEGAGGFDEGEDADGGESLGFGPRVCDDVADEGHVGCGVDFGDHEGGEVGGLQEGGEVGEREARGDGVDAHGAFVSVGGDRLVEGFLD